MLKILSMVLLAVVMAGVSGITFAAEAQNEDPATADEDTSTAPSASLNVRHRSAEERRAQYEIINNMSEEDRQQYFANRQIQQEEGVRQRRRGLTQAEQKNLINKENLARKSSKTIFK